MKLSNDTVVGIVLFVLVGMVMLYSPVGILMMEENHLFHANTSKGLHRYLHSFKALLLANLVISTLWLVNEYALKGCKNMLLAGVLGLDILVAGGLLGLLFAQQEDESLERNKKFMNSLKTLASVKIAVFAGLCGNVVIYPSVLCLH